MRSVNGFFYKARLRAEVVSGSRSDTELEKKRIMMMHGCMELYTQVEQHHSTMLNWCKKDLHCSTNSVLRIEP